MHDSQHITLFLARVRRSLRVQAGVRFGLFAVTLFALSAVAVPMVAWNMAPHHGSTISTVAFAVMTIALVGGLIVTVIVPTRQSGTDMGIARRVGTACPEMASDLLSAVEFCRQRDADERDERSAARGSPVLVDAFLAQISARVDTVQLRSVVSSRPLARAAIWCVAALGCLSASLLASPGHLVHGWERVLYPTDPRPFGGARMSGTPLVGDIRITVDYPAYTERAPRSLPSASGDVRAMPGSAISIETRALIPAFSARILLWQESPANTASAELESIIDIPFDVTDERVLQGQFRLQAAGEYRFSIEGIDAERHVEAQTRRIELEPDRPPEVQLYTPGDELDVASLERIELAYSAEDDYGISRIELVWTEAGSRRRKPLGIPENGQRTAQGKFLWDLEEASIAPGSETVYYIEVADNDTVSGPNIGQSASYRLRVFSPREKHEKLVVRQRELLERILRALAGRLTVAVDDVHAHQALQRETADLVVELGTLVAALREDELSAEKLREFLDDMRARLNKQTKAEAVLLERLRAKQERDDRPLGNRLANSDQAVIAELERDALSLSDWIERQQMENLLALTDEVEIHRARLKQLFKEYERKNAPELIGEIEREMRSLEKRLTDMTAQRGYLADDVLDRFVHTDAIQEQHAADCMVAVRALMQQGELTRSDRLLETCMGTLEQVTTAMEQSLRALRDDAFNDEERRFGEMMDKLSDLVLEQRDIAELTQSIWQRYAARADEMMREEAKETRRHVSKPLERLRRGLGQISAIGLTPFAKEELSIVDTRLADVDRMLADGDIAEALAMAEQARVGVQTASAELDAALLDQQDEPWGEHTKVSRRELRRVQPMIDKLVSDLAASTPSPNEIMSRRDRRRLERLSRRQQSVAERSRRLADKVEKTADELPGLSATALIEGVASARMHMERSNKRMRTVDPSGARQESRNAADAMQRTLEFTNDASRGSQGTTRAGLRDEPVRIPGTDEYKTPDAFREDILQAMKREQAPLGFGALVKRYYEELIR